MSFLIKILAALKGAPEDVQEEAIEASVSIEDALQLQYDRNPDEWRVTCGALNHAVVRLKQLPIKSMFLEALIDGLSDLVSESIEHNINR